MTKAGKEACQKDNDKKKINRLKDDKIMSMFQTKIVSRKKRIFFIFIYLLKVTNFVFYTFLHNYITNIQIFWLCI